MCGEGVGWMSGPGNGSTLIWFFFELWAEVVYSRL